MLGHGAIGELAIGQIPDIPEPIVIDASDVLLVALSDSLSPIEPTLDVSDTFPLVFAEVVSSSGDVSASDTLSVLIADTLATLVAANVSDATLLALNDTLTVLAGVDQSDDITLSLVETESVSAVLTASDELDVAVSDAITVLSSLNRNDALSVLLADFLIPTIWNKPRSAIGKIAAGSVSGRIRGKSHVADPNLN